MLQRRSSLASRRLLVLFVVTTLTPAIGLTWLGWRMVEQDRALESQRAQERREHAADLSAAALERVLVQLEGNFDARKVSEGVAKAVFGPQGLIERSGTLLPYYPAVPAAAEPSPEVFASVETLEFQGPEGSARAIPALDELVKAQDPLVKAGALVRLARNHRKTGNLAGALTAFRELGELGDTRINGSPAGLLARQGTALILEASGRHEDLKREAALLDADLRNGRWLLTRASYEFSREQTRRWLGNGNARFDGRESLALAEAAEMAWKGWQSSAGGRRTVWVQDQSVLVLSRSSMNRLDLLLAGPRFIESAWLAELHSLRVTQQVNFALTDADGRAVLGRPDAPQSRQSVRTASATRLPWTVHAISAENGGTSGRRRILLAGIVMLAVLILGGGYFVNRAISREIAVAKLQTDFVATVSHEFRTPLTTMRQLSELLVQDRVSSQERRRQFYDVLLRESTRLHRLVDGLLNFGRMEAGEIHYRFEPLDPAALLRDVVGEFRQEASKTGYHVEFQESVGVAPIKGDRESLGRVFWNLLDNAVKYSPDCRTVWVELAGAGKQIMVRVRDRGLGIPSEEQKEIFRKFVRGAASKAAAIKGTGVGLAMARQIVEAHGGEIAVESKPGEGSTFTVLLPPAE